MLKTLNILALVLVIVSASVSCYHIPLRREFHRASKVEGVCLDKAYAYAINCYVAGMDPRIVITHLKSSHKDLHAVVSFDAYPGVYYDPTNNCVWTERDIGDIKFSYKHPFKLGAD